jgi:tetratricopeptide (TPR) repeat protein
MKKQLDLTKSVLSQINTFRKNKAERYNQDAIRLFRLGEKEAAIKDFKKALYLTPKFSESFPKEEIAYSLALVYRSLEDVKKELKYYSKSLFYNPRFYNGWYWKGKTYFNLASKKNMFDDLSLRGRWLISLKNPRQFYREAIYCFTNAIKSSDDNAKPYYYAGYCYEQLGDSKKAVEMFDTVFEIEPGFENLNKSKIFNKIKNAPEDKTECSNCKYKVKQGDAFCADCGTELK